MPDNYALERVRRDVGDLLYRASKHFKPGARMTIIARQPGKPEQDFVLTDDTLDEIAALVERRKEAGG